MITTSGYTYDNVGNMTGDPAGTTYAYDAENKQVNVSNGGGILGRYYYDGDGKRAKKLASGDNKLFIYDAVGKLIQERATSGGYAAQTSYIYAGSRLLSTENEVSPATNYLTADHLGTPRINTDGSGNVTARHDYLPFGEEILTALTAQRTSGVGYPGADGVRKQFTGYERDNEINLDFAQARYMSSALGRFNSPDPMMASALPSDPQTFNRYSYVINLPTSFTDPQGLAPVSGSACGQWCDNGSSYLDGSAFRGRDAMYDGLAPLDSYDPVSKTATPEEKRIDAVLTAIFTDTGFVRAASSGRNDPPRPGGEVTDSHYRFVDGKLHTIHIYGNESASESAGVYIPKAFSEVNVAGSDLVVATNPKTREVLMINHVQVANQKELRENMKTERKNGTVYIGQIGGRGGEANTDARGMHSHLVLFANARSQAAATSYKKKNWEYTSEISRHLSDFRKLAR